MEENKVKLTPEQERLIKEERDKFHATLLKYSNRFINVAANIKSKESVPHLTVTEAMSLAFCSMLIEETSIALSQGGQGFGPAEFEKHFKQLLQNFYTQACLNAEQVLNDQILKQMDTTNVPEH